MPIANLESDLLFSGWQLSALPPQERVLAHVILAVTSFISTNALIIGPTSESTSVVVVVGQDNCPDVDPCGRKGFRAGGRDCVERELPPR